MMSIYLFKTHFKIKILHNLTKLPYVYIYIYERNWGERKMNKRIPLLRKSGLNWKFTSISVNCKWQISLLESKGYEPYRTSGSCFCWKWGDGREKVPTLLLRKMFNPSNLGNCFFFLYFSKLWWTNNRQNKLIELCTKPWFMNNAFLLMLSHLHEKKGGEILNFKL